MHGVRRDNGAYFNMKPCASISSLYSGLKQKNVQFLIHWKIQKPTHWMRDERTKTCPHDAVPCRPINLIKLLQKSRSRDHKLISSVQCLLRNTVTPHFLLTRFFKNIFYFERFLNSSYLNKNTIENTIYIYI